jgi:hypothetical protein
MSDSHLAMLVCSGWLASILVGVSIDVWRMRRRQHLAQAARADVEGSDPRHAGAPSRRALLVRPRDTAVAAAPLDSFDGVPHSSPS